MNRLISRFIIGQISKVQLKPLFLTLKDFGSAAARTLEGFRDNIRKMPNQSERKQSVAFPPLV